MAGRVVITDRFVKNLKAPQNGNYVRYDENINGFGVRITANGVRAFILNYYANKRERRLTIGRYPNWTVVAAREEAKRLRREIDRGDDPLARRVEKREAPTVEDLWNEYKKKHLPSKRPRSGKDDASMWRNYILPAVGKIKLVELTPSDIDELHAEISKEKPVRANRVVEVLRKALNLAVRWKWLAENPSIGVNMNAEEARTRYASSDELQRLSNALADHPNQDSCDAIRLMLLTGARKGEVLRSRWKDIDLIECTWVKPSAHTKQNREHRVPLSKGVCTMLEGRRSTAAQDSIWVFPGNKAGQPLTDIKRTWRSVCEMAKVDDLTLHDLRRTYASILASSGHTLQLVGTLLGHTQQQTTLRYAYLFDDPLREGVATVDLALKGLTRDQKERTSN